jgi:hypothetical protein
MAGDAGIRRIGELDFPVPQGRWHFDPEVRQTPGHEKPSYNKGLMKKLVFLIAALAMVGCSKQGGTEDQYNSNTGSSRSGTATISNDTYRVTPDSSSVNTNSSSSTNTPSLPQ